MLDISKNNCCIKGVIKYSMYESSLGNYRELSLYHKTLLKVIDSVDNIINCETVVFNHL